MRNKIRLIFVVAVFTCVSSAAASAQSARIFEETRVLTTYPFSEPNPVPILTRDPRLYPYHTFEGYTNDPVDREWKVVKLENDLIEVFVLPEVGGKVWGAIVKETGHEFIYRNEVMKFRNIALRGPWTSGGIEFNFGVIGHTPATATPVNYLTRQNEDGSVSCFVGTMDLPSRTQWRVEIRLPADRAYFETNVLWYNPTPLEQPYYNWMTAAAFAQYDLEMAMPGNGYLTHPGDWKPWPTDSAGRYLPSYANNTFGGHKSYHVVGELNDFFGGYYHNDDYGFGHWSRYEEMPGQKLWLWALSREGGVWEDLLTDTDGQYVEFQAGRLFVQYSPGSDVNPITQAAFGPGTADRWSETWFPLEGIGGLTDASRDGAMAVTREGGMGNGEGGNRQRSTAVPPYRRTARGGERGGESGERGAGSGVTDRITVRINAFGDIADTLKFYVGHRVVSAEPIDFGALEVVERHFEVPVDSAFRVQLPALALNYTSDRSQLELSRPFEEDPEARSQISEVDIRVFEAREFLKARRFRAARELFEQAIAEEPWNREALLGMADLQYRRALYESGLEYANKALQLDAYDAKANFLAGNLYRAMGRRTDAREAFGWAARSMEFRSAAYVQLAELQLAASHLDESMRYARLAIDYDRYNIPAREVLAISARMARDTEMATTALDEILEIDPLNQFARFELSISSGDGQADALREELKGEYPEQVLLELGIDYFHRYPWGPPAVFALGSNWHGNPIAEAWLFYLGAFTETHAGSRADPGFAFPYRRETLAALEAVVSVNDHWSWSYLLALNLWALDREAEAAELMSALGDAPDYAPAYVARAELLSRVRGTDPEPDLRRAVLLDGDKRILHIHLIRFLQEQNRWDDALEASSSARQIFPDDFNLDLMHVRTLNNLGRATGAIGILANIHVLPSENARESHRLYEQAHLIAALDAMDGGNHQSAISNLQSALEWPEHLGQGRPYEPEERMVRFLLGLAEAELGNQEESAEAFELVAAATMRAGARPGMLDLLAIPSLAALERTEEFNELRFDPDSAMGRIAAELISTVETGGDYGATLTGLAVEHAELFEDLEGSLLLRALTAAEMR